MVYKQRGDAGFEIHAAFYSLAQCDANPNTAATPPIAPESTKCVQTREQKKFCVIITNGQQYTDHPTPNTMQSQFQ